MPLAPIPLANEAYQLASKPAVQHRVVNMVAEKLPDGARSPFALKPTAGLELAATLGAGPVLASATIGGSYFAVSGNAAYRCQDTTPIVPNYLGNVGYVPSDFYHVTIAIGLTAVVICVPPRIYVTDFGGAPVVQVTAGSGDFPAEGASSVAYVDGYFVFTSFTGSYFFTSALLDATNYDGLSFVRLSAEVDFVEHCVAHQGDLWLMGQNTVSAWYNSGDPTTPFSPRRSGATIRHGLGAPYSVVQLDGSLWWVGVDNVVYRTAGYQAKRVSTHAIEELLSNYGGGYLRTISACGFMHEGHAFYSLSLPVIGRTFVYDCSTSLWAERCSAADGIGRWAINTASALSARVLLGDSADGRLWHMLSTVPTEKGIAVSRQATLPAIVTHGPRAFMPRLEIEMEVGTTGAPGTVRLDWSDDGGITFTPTPRALSTGALGATRTRVATTRLGSFRQRVLRLAASAPLTVYAVDADIAKGES